MNIRIILALSTMIGITLGGFLARQTEAGASQNFSRSYVAQATTTAAEDSYPSRQRLAVAESRTEANLTDAEPIPAGERVKVGERDARVPMIRARMVKLGFLSEENSLAWMLGHAADKVSKPMELESILDKELSKAIKAFQKASGIEQTGRVDKATVAALNAPETAVKQRQAEEIRMAQEAALALAKQRQAEEERQRQAAEVERQRLAAEAAEKQRQAEEERKAQEAALVVEKQRQAEEAERLAENKKFASIDSASEAEASSKSCNKAMSIIGKYGFEDIETKSCKGKVYHFSATRQGKRFSVKINPLTSALTEVKRVLSSAVE